MLYDTRVYDGAGRLTYAGEREKPSDPSRNATLAAGSLSQRRTYSYDAGGHVTRQELYNYDLPDQNIYFVKGHGNDLGGYDAMGNLTGYTVAATNIDNNDFGRYTIQYLWTDGAHEQFTKQIKDQTAVESVYDTFGNRIQVIDEKGQVKRQFWYDADGHVQSKLDGDTRSFSLIVNGQVLGDENSSKTNILGSPYQSATAQSLAAPPSVYSVQSPNETLQSIAQAIWGDAKLWYLIADANGLAGDAALKVNDILRIPTRINTAHNDYATVKPYYVAEDIGDTTPAMPTPSQHGGGCGPLGSFIMAAVSAAVIYATGGMAMPLQAALGSIAGQVVGMAIGAQDGFSWKGVALAALSAGVAQGVSSLSTQGGLLSAISGEGWQAAAAQAAVSNIATQGIANLTGLQHGFSWASVAGASVGAAVGSALRNDSDFKTFMGSYTNLAAATAAGISGGLTTAVARGGKIQAAYIATDAFGNALGSSLAARSSGTPDLSANEWDKIRQESMNVERTAGIFDVTNPIDFRNSGGVPTMSDSLGSFGEGMSSASVIVQGTRTFDPTKDSLLFNGQNGDGSMLVRKSLPDGSTIDTYANGYNFTDANGNATFSVADTSDTVLTGKLYQEAADRNYYLSKKYDPNSLGDQILNIFTGAMNDPSRVMTDRERTEHESLSNMFLHQTDMALNPEKYSQLLQRIDNVRGSATGTAGYLAARAVGVSQEYQDKFSQLGNGLGGLALARSAAVSGGPAYTGAKGTPDLSPNSGIPAGGAKRVVPLGFDRGSQFLNAAGELKSALETSGITDARIGVQGSSAAGGSARKGTFFGPQSDIDFFIESAQLSNGRKTSNNIPGMVFTNPLLRDYPLLRDWSNNWSNTLNRKTTPAAFVPGSVPNEPSIWID